MNIERSVDYFGRYLGYVFIDILVYIITLLIIINIYKDISEAIFII
jgi:hypothetical protein